MQAIADLLHRDLTRKIEEIIQVDQADEQSVHAEITEYVATDSIREQYHLLLKAIAEAPSDPQEGIGVWVSQSEANFERYLEDEENMDPTFGWLATRLGFYEENTLSLKTRVHFQGDNMRPVIELEPTDHPLAVDQREGITLEKAWKIVHRYMD